MSTSETSPKSGGEGPVPNPVLSSPAGLGIPQLPASPSPVGQAGGALPVAGWDLSALAQAMLGALADPNQLVLPAAKAGFTPSLAAAGASEPAIMTNTPGVSPSVVSPTRHDGRGALPTGVPVSTPGSLPSLPAPGFSPAGASAPTGVDALAGSDLSLDLFFVPLLRDLGDDPRVGHLPSAGAAAPGAPSDISLIDSQEIGPASVPQTKALRQESFDPYAVRRQFPILNERVNGRRLVWLDNAATTQKPQAVIDRLSYFYAHENSNVHRGAHTLAARATDAYEGARKTVAKSLGASSPQDIVFVRGATEAINLVAQSWGGAFVGAGDEIVITHLEHHAIIVPWQQLCARTGARLRVAPVNDRGEILLDAYGALLCPRTKLVALTQVSNALGTVTPVQQMVAMAHAVGARALVDGAQAVAHFPAAYERNLLTYATAELSKIPGLRIIGTAAAKAGVVSFVLQDRQTEGMGAALDKEGIAVRSGHHCAQPILRRLGLEATMRASFAPYNVCEDVDALVAALMLIIGR